MLLKQKLVEAIDAYLAEPDRLKVQLIRINISIPKCSLFFWIGYSDLMLEERGRSDGQLIVYFSTRNRSRREKKILETIEMFDLFSEYRRVSQLIYYKVAGRVSTPIADEVVRIISILFPTLNQDSVGIEVHRRDILITIS